MPKLKSKYKKINEWEKHQLRPFYINKILDIVWSQEIWLHKKKNACLFSNNQNKLKVLSRIFQSAKFSFQKNRIFKFMCCHNGFFSFKGMCWQRFVDNWANYAGYKNDG